MAPTIDVFMTEIARGYSGRDEVLVVDEGGWFVVYQEIGVVDKCWTFQQCISGVEAAATGDDASPLVGKAGTRECKEGR